MVGGFAILAAGVKTMPKQCERCSGDGEIEVDCPQCGNSDYFEYEDDNLVPARCDVCNERGTVREMCPDCGGWGEIDEHEEDEEES